ncbi:hypothetical protein PoB_003037200 [Plakobranchus ocellatus]|uniref:Uncharacterized protein n=1 Tax=Plakobranchus ocellatus TaxID=259542 RepID=A0AAV4AAG8_9GAST|nr:hypothetical protein PoB_003037200 [Plakobranchus ocellatus]
MIVSECLGLGEVAGVSTTASPQRQLNWFKFSSWTDNSYTEAPGASLKALGSQKPDRSSLSLVTKVASVARCIRRDVLSLGPGVPGSGVIIIGCPLREFFGHALALSDLMSNNVIVLTGAIKGLVYTLSVLIDVTGATQLIISFAVW